MAVMDLRGATVIDLTGDESPQHLSDNGVRNDSNDGRCPVRPADQAQNSKVSSTARQAPPAHDAKTLPTSNGACRDGSTTALGTVSQDWRRYMPTSRLDATAYGDGTPNHTLLTKSFSTRPDATTFALDEENVILGNEDMRPSWARPVDQSFGGTERPHMNGVAQSKRKTQTGPQSPVEPVSKRPRLEQKAAELGTRIISRQSSIPMLRAANESIADFIKRAPPEALADPKHFMLVQSPDQSMESFLRASKKYRIPDPWNLPPFAVPDGMVRSTYGLTYGPVDDFIAALQQEEEDPSMHTVAAFSTNPAPPSYQKPQQVVKSIEQPVQEKPFRPLQRLKAEPTRSHQNIQTPVSTSHSASRHQVPFIAEEAQEEPFRPVQRFQAEPTRSYQHIERPGSASQSASKPAALPNSEEAEEAPFRPFPKSKAEPTRIHPQIKEPASTSQSASRHGVPYSAEEDALLLRLRSEGVAWAILPEYFNGRTQGSLQVRYSTKLGAGKAYEPARPRGRPRLSEVQPVDSDSGVDTASGMRRFRRKTTHREPVLDRESPLEASRPRSANGKRPDYIEPTRQIKEPPSHQRLLRYREFGTSRHPSYVYRNSLLELQDHAYSTMGPCKHLDEAPGDVATIAWSPNGRHFAAGAVALNDENSMQYNRPRNLMIGDIRGVVQELPDHHVPRPRVNRGVNASHSMRRTQDERLFTTVQSVAFSPNGSDLYSCSIDGRLNLYRLGSAEKSIASLTDSFQHDAPVDFLSVSNKGLIATGSRQRGKESISIFSSDEGRFMRHYQLGTTKSWRGEDIFPSALKWGVSPAHSQYLLAGFAQDKEVLYSDAEPQDILGETCLFDGMTGQAIEVQTIYRTVFDVCWNPNQSGRTAFAVASVGAGRLNSGMHSVVRLFASGQSNKCRSQMELECPARDLNDVVYSPYDDNLIAAGSTDGKVYIWDTRYYNQHPTPLRSIAHGSCLSILPHDVPRWETDTGIRFLSWGATRTQLYSGSSDGVVRCWNPYLSPEEGHYKDIATFDSAIMSGAFSPDFDHLLIGQDTDRLNLLSIGNEGRSLQSMDKFDVIHAPEPPGLSEERPDTSLLRSGQVEFRPAGALPIRQAVVHPSLIPDATLTINSVQNDDEVDNDFGEDGPLFFDDDEPSPTIDVTESETERLRAQAALFQDRLYAQRQKHKDLLNSFMSYRPDPCTLGCDYKPFAYDDDARVTDNGRARGRIPDSLRAAPLKGIAAIRQGLVAKCASCGDAALPNERVEERILCERCGFACFRCGRKAEIDVRRGRIGCLHCGVLWRADVLGYQVIGGDDDQPRETKETRDGKEVIDSDAEMDRIEERVREVELGDEELERLLDMAS